MLRAPLPDTSPRPWSSCPSLIQGHEAHQLQTRITAFSEVERDKRATKIALPRPKLKPDYRAGCENLIRKLEAPINWAIETVDRRMYENGKA